MDKFLSFVLTPVGLFFQGFVIQKLWFWFITSLGVPEIEIAQGIGIGLLFSILKGLSSYDIKHMDENSDTLRKQIIGIVFCLFILIFGFIVSLFL